MPPSSTSSTAIQSPPTSGNVAGMLRVEVMSARNLHAAVLGSLLKWTPNYSNPYVVVTLHRDEFTTSTKEKLLNPTWKEMAQLKVLLPTEQELLQTVGVHQSIHSVEASAVDGTGKIKTLSKGVPTGPHSGEFQPCYPQLKVQVYHRSDEAQVGSPSRTGQRQQIQTVRDKLIGEVVVPILPCLMSSTSSSRTWYTLLSDEHPDAGQIQLALHYDVGGLEPLKGDIVRLAGFGGMEYYAKLVNANARLEVVDVFQDQVFAQYKSVEGWMLSFEFHRNLLFVVRRPSILKDAQSQLHGQIVRVKHSPLVTKVHNVWQAIPLEQRRYMFNLYQLVVFSGGTAYEVVSRSVSVAMHDGINAGIKTCVDGSSVAAAQVSLEAMRLLWADQSDGPGRRRSPARDSRFHLEGGPESGRGKIVQGFGGDDASEIKLLTNGSHDDDEYVVDPISDEEEEKEEEDAGLPEELMSGARDTIDEEDDDEDEAAAARHWIKHCPDQLICPITGCPMLDPVVAADGHSYEREAILQWFATSNKSPMTGAQMPTTQVFPNYTLRKLSEEFQSKTKAARK